MAGGGTSGGGAFRYPYDFTSVTEEIRAKLDRMNMGHDWERLIDDFMGLIMDRDRALEDYTTAGTGSILFTTVDGNGDGDYTSIKEAIEAVAAYPASSPGQAFSVIYVKPFYNSGNGYDEDGLGNIALPSPSTIMVWAGGMSGANVFNQATSGGQQRWFSDGFDVNSSSTWTLALVGFEIQLAANKALINSTEQGGSMIVDNCYILPSTAGYGLRIPSRIGGVWHITNSRFPLFTNAATVSSGGGAARTLVMYAESCIVTWGGTALTTINWSGTDNVGLDAVFRGCEIQPSSTQVTLNGGTYSGTGGSRLEFDDCRMGLGSATFSFNKIQLFINGWRHHFKRDSDNSAHIINVTDPINIDNSTGAFSGVGWMIRDMVLPGASLTVTDSVVTNAFRGEVNPGVIDCQVRHLTLAANACLVNLAAHLYNSSATPTLTVSGNYNNIQAAMRYTVGGTGAAMSAAPGALVTGNNNILWITAQHIATPWTDVGGGNIINGGFTGSPVTMDMADARGDLLVGFSDNDIRRFPVGSDDQVLTARSSATAGVAWEDPLDYDYNVKGDILVASGDNSPARLGVGRDQRVPRAASAEFVGVSWDYQRTLKNKLTANQASLETDTSGWTAESGCTIARNATQASHGTASLEITKS